MSSNFSTASDKKFYQDFIDSLPQALLVFEKKADSSSSTPNYLCTFVNQAFKNLFSEHSHIVLNQTLSGSLNSEILDPLWNNLQMMSKQGLPFQKLDHLQSQNYEIIAHPFLNGFTVSLLKVPSPVIPISSEELLEEEESKRAKLNAEKLLVTGKIARNIAHEVRNPLTNLNMALEQLKDELDEEVEEDSVDLYIEIIKRNADRIEKLISELLTTTKPKKLNLKALPINQVLQETARLVADRIHLRDIKLIEDYKTQPDTLLLLDVPSIKTAFLNILINAIEAIQHHQGVLVIHSQEEKEYIRVQIKDNGEGIPQENLKKLFDPFFTSKEDGMGLGLTSTRNIIQGHQASIYVESELNQGTTFHVLFPKYSSSN